MQIKKFQQGGSVVAAKKGLNTKELKAAGYSRDVQNNAYYNAKAALRRNTDLRGKALRQAAADQVNALVPAQPAVERPALVAPAAQLSTPQLAVSPIAPLESRAQYTALKVADMDRQEQMRAARQADEAKAAQDAIDAMSFSQAFRQARNAAGGRNDGQFTWRGRRFTTNTKKAAVPAAPVEEEIVDNEILLDPAVALQYRENLNNMNTYNALTDISDPALYDVDAMPSAGLSNITYYTSPTLRSNGMPMRRETVVNPRATLLPGPYNARAVVSDKLVNSGDPNNWMIENYDDNSSEFNELSANTTLEGAFDATRRKGSRRALNPGVVGPIPANKKGNKLPSCELGKTIPQIKIDGPVGNGVSNTPDPSARARAMENAKQQSSNARKRQRTPDVHTEDGFAFTKVPNDIRTGVVMQSTPKGFYVNTPIDDNYTTPSGAVMGQIGDTITSTKDLVNVPFNDPITVNTAINSNPFSSWMVSRENNPQQRFLDVPPSQHEALSRGIGQARNRNSKRAVLSAIQQNENNAAQVRKSINDSF